MKIFSKHSKKCACGRQRRRGRRLGLESLEARNLLAIVWENRLNMDPNDSVPDDTFTAAERAVIDAAINAWENVVVDFDSDPFNAPLPFSVTITGGRDIGSSLAQNIFSSNITPSNARPNNGRISLMSTQFLDGTSTLTLPITPSLQNT
jgi:hypothetical protein